MSHVLHAWEGPAPDGADDAAALVEGRGGGNLVASARFPDFVAELRKKYPDAGMLESRGKDPEKSVWSDSPLSGEAHGPVLALGLRLENVDRKLIHFIVKTAGAHGLHVYDAQTGELWRKGDPPPPRERPRPPRLPTPEAPMMALHRFARVAPWDPGHRPPPPRTAGEHWEVDAAQALRVVGEPVASALGAFGWREGRSDGKRVVLTRTVGPARQVIAIYVGDTAGLGRPPERILSVNFGFEIPAVQETLFRLHPRWRKKRASARAIFFDECSDIPCRVKDLFGVESSGALGYTLITPTSAAVRVRGRGDLSGWAALFSAWYASQAEPLLAACTDLATLNRFLNNGRRLSTGMEHGDWELLSTLALAWIAPHEEVRWEDCLTGVRYRADRLALDEALIERTILALQSLPREPVA